VSAGLEGRGLACLRGERTVFRGLDLAVPPGGALLLTGPNGAGKSTLLRLIAGLLRPAAGRLLWAGADTAEDPEAFRARLAYVGHQDAVKPAFGVAENLAFWARAGGGGDVGAALAAVGLEGLAAMPASVLSAGQRRRLSLARLALRHRDLWLLDEPAVTLDASSVARLGTLVAGHRARGGAVVVATHGDLSLPDAAALDLGRAA